MLEEISPGVVFYSHLTGDSMLIERVGKTGVHLSVHGDDGKKYYIVKPSFLNQFMSEYEFVPVGETEAREFGVY